MTELPDPSFRRIIVGGLPRFLRDGVVPLLAFYGGWRFAGLGAGIGLSTVASAALWALERRAGRDGLLVRLSLAFCLVQAAVGAISDSAVVYLAQPVLANAAWYATRRLPAAFEAELGGETGATTA